MRLLLNGDIQNAAICALLDSGVELRADVCDLPHHGSFVDASPRWLKRVAPKMVLQSSGPRRLRQDHWGPVLDAAEVPRLSGTQCGMVQLDFGRDGTIQVARFKAVATPDR